MAIKKIKDWSDETKALLIRMWAAGAVALFIAWTPVGGGEIEGDAFLFPLIFMLALGLMVFNTIVINPVVKGMFRTRMDKRKYLDTPLFDRVIKHLLHFVEMVFIVILIWLSYALINITLGLFGVYGANGRPFIMLEPITFGLLYGLYFSVIDKIKDYSYTRLKNKKP